MSAHHDSRPKVVVELAGSVRSRDWAERHARGEVVDATPYGFHRLAQKGFVVWIRDSSPSRDRIDGMVLHRTKLTWGHTLAPSHYAPFHPDCLIAWSERGGIPAVWRERITGRGTPVISGVIWITDDPDPRLRRAARAGLRRCAALFVLSRAQVEPARALVGPDGPPIHYVPFGIETSYFDRAAVRSSDPLTDPGLNALAARGPFMISAGNDPSRDNATLARALRQLPEAPPLFLATRLRGQFEGAESMTIGELSVSQLRVALARASLFVMATRHNIHASGITAALEASSMGLPVIATRTPGMEEYILHGETGFLTPAGDDTALAEAIATLLADPDLAREMGRRGHHRTRQLHDVDRMQEDLAELIMLTVSTAAR